MIQGTSSYTVCSAYRIRLPPVLARSGSFYRSRTPKHHVTQLDMFTNLGSLPTLVTPLFRMYFSSKGVAAHCQRNAMQAACHMQSGASASYAASLLPSTHWRMSFQNLGQSPLRSRTLHYNENSSLLRRGAAQHVTRSSTAATDVAEAVQREPVQAQFDWHRQWYPVSWEQCVCAFSSERLSRRAQTL